MELAGFLKSMAFEKRGAGGKPAAAYPFITVSRQAGAGGHSFALALMRALDREPSGSVLSGWHVFDQEICTLLAEDPKLRVSLRALLDEEYHNQIEDLFAQWVAGISPQYAINKKVLQTVRTLALAGKAILIGRGAACYTRDIPEGIHLRLVAPERLRVETLAKRLRCSEKEALKAARQRDAARERFVSACFSRDISDPTLYDAVWNTGTMGMEHLADIAVDWIKRLAREPAAS